MMTLPYHANFLPKRQRFFQIISFNVSLHARKAVTATANRLLLLGTYKHLVVWYLYCLKFILHTIRDVLLPHGFGGLLLTAIASQFLIFQDINFSQVQELRPFFQSQVFFKELTRSINFLIFIVYRFHHQEFTVQ